MKTADRIEFFSRLRELNPHPKTELLYTSEFELLIAVMLSAQSTDVGVNKVTRRLYPVANTPQAILALGLPALRKAISTLGLYNAKAANVHETCRLLVERHDGMVPREREALEALSQSVITRMGNRPSTNYPLSNAKSYLPTTSI